MVVEAMLMAFYNCLEIVFDYYHSIPPLSVLDKQVCGLDQALPIMFSPLLQQED